MSKERLKEVVKNVVFNECGLTGAPMSVELLEDDFWYLYEQAERVYELEQQNKRYREYLELIVYELEQQNKRYREALELYANEDN